MSQLDPSERVESGIETARSMAEGGEHASTIVEYLRTGVDSGTLPALVGGVGLLSGLRALLSGNRRGGLVRLVAGGALLAVAFRQRRAASPGEVTDIEETDVVDTGPDVETISDEAGDVGEEEQASGEEAAAVADTSPDVEGASSGIDSEPDFDTESAPVDQREVADTGVDTENLEETAETEPDIGGGAETESESVEEGEVADTGVEREDFDEDPEIEPEELVESEEADRLGEAAFDQESQEVPAPQRAFNLGHLAHGNEAFWGVRSDDGAVLVSQDYDAIEDREGVQYMASSEIGEDARELAIPKTILNHWDAELGGGAAVTGGDDILFVTNNSLTEDGLLRVLPAEWADEELDAAE